MASKTKGIIDIDQLYLKQGNYTRTLLIIGVVGLVIFSFIAVLVALGQLNLGLIWVYWVMIGLMIFSGPYGFYASWRMKKTKDIENRLPDFLRDVAEAGRFGMNLAQAIKVSSKGRYGSLTPEIQRMAAQIDWGVPVSEALRLFSERVDTPLTKRMVSIIIKANDAGGSVADVLTMVAHDARETMINENERKISMATYTVVIYVSFAVFLATIFILNTTFLPNMEIAGAQVREGAERMGITSMPNQIQTQVIPEIQMIFIISVAIHAFGDGILAGVVQDGAISNGLRHSFIMLVIGFLGTTLV
ncbi:MAG: flagellar assembly protein J [Methanomassiliicoccales archaeon PtaU1.Bin124]|nr:MAG: flagellar assembly protein J [Methanomassiliicoccales archaeon PtaU1.Bin124]